MKVFIIDRNGALDDLARLLAAEGCSVLRFRTAMEAVTGLIKARPDVLVCELPLAGSTLEELARAARVANPRADLVVVGSSSAEEEVRARALNVVFYAVRPVEAETLREVVLTACAAVARGEVNA